MIRHAVSGPPQDVTALVAPDTHRWPQRTAIVLYLDAPKGTRDEPADQVVQCDRMQISLSE
jgi:hypothetical protein